jgi:hypothetical protein
VNMQEDFDVNKSVGFSNGCSTENELLTVPDLPPKSCKKTKTRHPRKVSANPTSELLSLPIIPAAYPRSVLDSSKPSPANHVSIHVPLIKRHPGRSERTNRNSTKTTNIRDETSLALVHPLELGASMSQDTDVLKSSLDHISQRSRSPHRLGDLPNKPHNRASPAHPTFNH